MTAMTKTSKRLSSHKFMALGLVATLGLLVVLTLGLVGRASAASTVTFSDFTAANLGLLQLNGDTAGLNPNSDDVLRLTTNVGGQAGSAFLKDAISLAGDASFSTAFQFRISSPGNGGADGLVFVVQTNSNTAGGGGGGIGYLGIDDSVGIEFDNWDNGSIDGNSANHVGINLNGIIASDPLADVSGLGQLENGNIWYAWVDYDGTTLEVRLSTTSTRPGSALLTKTVDLVNVLGTTVAFIGFTSGTGGANAKHDILAWSFTNDFDPIVDPLPAPGAPLINTFGPATYTEGEAPVIVDSSLTLTSTDDIDGAKVSIGAGFKAAEDTLGVDGALPAGLTSGYNSTTGVLTISGDAPASTYQTALRQVTYSNSSGDPDLTAREITFSIGSGLAFPDNGHFYEFVAGTNPNWNDAKSTADNKSLFGLQGYLATITSAAENAFVFNKLQGNGWLGATDTADEGTWEWVTGPEAGTVFCIGTGTCVSSGGAYTNWDGGEPNQSGNEDYAHMIGNTALNESFWNDLPVNGGTGNYVVQGYVVEYGGSAGDPSLQLSGTVTVNVVEQPCQDGAAGGDLVSYWRGEGNACDSADGNHGSMENGAGFAAGKVGQAFSLDGVNDYVEVPDSANLHSNEITVKGWFKVDNLNSPSTWQNIYWKGDTPDCTAGCANREYTLWLHNSGQLAFASAPVGSSQLVVWSPTGTVAAGQWYHFATVISTSGNSMQLYINGVLIGSVSYPSVGMQTTTGPLRFGFANNPIWDPDTSSNANFGGLIDEVKVYNTAHTAAEIKAQYDKENNGPISLWPAEGNADDLIDNNDGTLVNGAGFAAGIFGQGFDFDGADDYVTFGTGPVITGTGPFAVEAWVATTDSEGVIIQQRSAAVFNGEYVLSVGGVFLAGNLGRVCWATYGNSQFGFNFCSTQTVNDGAFHHIAGVREADGTGRIYIDGVLDSSQSAPPRTLVAIDVYIGKDVRDGIRALDGQIDEVSIWNRALTACEVAVNALVPCDVTPPVVTVPADITEEATSAAGAVVTFSPIPSANDNVDGAITPTCDATSGDTFPIDTTTVTCSATDQAGNTGEASFDVTVEDTTPPDVTVPGDITEEATSGAGAAVSFSPPSSANDIVDGDITPTCTANSGDTFPIDTTEVTCSATDQAGNTGQASFDVTVEDTTPPDVTVPGDITEEATSAAGAAVSFSPLPSANDIVDGDITPTCTAASGDTFPIDTTEVTCSATDQAGNTGQASFDVTVEDTTPPTVTAPQPLTLVECTSSSGISHSDSAVQAWLASATASDIVDGSVAVSNDASGTGALGTTTIEFSASDSRGNGPTTAQSTITVVDTTVPEVTAELVAVPGKVEEDEGWFDAVYSCSDVCDDSPVAVGRMMTPSLDGLEIKMKKHKRVRVVFDFEDGEVKIWGPNDASRQDTLAQLQDGGLLIPSGQRVHFEVEDDDEEATFQFDKRGNLKIEAPLSMMMLKVTCTDANGNSSDATAAPGFVAEEEEEEEDEDEDEEDEDEDEDEEDEEEEDEDEDD